MGWALLKSICPGDLDNTVGIDGLNYPLCVAFQNQCCQNARTECACINSDAIAQVHHIIKNGVSMDHHFFQWALVI